MIKVAEQIIEKAQQILDGLYEGHFETGKDWYPETYENYYLYFSDPDYETRKLSILVFAAAIGNSRRGVAVILQSDRTIADTTAPEYEGNFRFAYSFEKYLNAFLEHKEAIKKEFPLLYKVILAELKLWHDEKSFFTIFSDVNKELLGRIIDVIKDIHVRNSDLNLDPMLKEEIKWPVSPPPPSIERVIGPDGKITYLRHP